DGRDHALPSVVGRGRLPGPEVELLETVADPGDVLCRVVARQQGQDARREGPPAGRHAAAVEAHAFGGRRARWSRNSARVRSRVRKRPRTADVVMIVPGLRTPRMTAHRWVASMTTPTPCGASRSWRKSATCWVSRSWTCRRRAYISTMRGILDRPMTRPRGIYATAAVPKNGRRWCSHSE